MYEQDYIMRVIREMVRMILKLIFNIDTEKVTEDILDRESEREKLHKLLELIENGKINDAENRLYELLDKGDSDSLKLALIFYSYLNEKEEDFLVINNFSREEIKLGLKDVTSKFGYDMTDILD